MGSRAKAVVRAIARDPARYRATPGAALQYDPENARCHPWLGLAAFERFCSRHLKVFDGVRRAVVPFVWFPGQRRVAAILVAGGWPIVLKGRQLGVTWLVAAYVCWRMVYTPRYRAAVVLQERRYAEEFVDRVRHLHGCLPGCIATKITTDNHQELEFRGGGHHTRLDAMVGSENTARSLTADLVVFDEASRVKSLAKGLVACQPAIDSAGGQICVMTTSAGPVGDFYDLWQASYGNIGEAVEGSGAGPTGYTPVFLHWSERPGRDAAWHEKQRAILAELGPVAMQQEHPETPQEAFEFASGRIYPTFTLDRCVGTMEIPAKAVRYRAIDWGAGASAQVCLWIAHLEEEPPGLLVSPTCPELIREMLGYRYDDDHPDQPVKIEDHACDALRYAIGTFRLHGLVYVYQESYIVQSGQKGWTPMKLVAEYHRMSGWVEAGPEFLDKWVRGPQGDDYHGTVADRSRVELILQFSAEDLPTQPHRKPVIRAPKGAQSAADNPSSEVLDGIGLVSNLIDGSYRVEKQVPLTKAAEAIATLMTDRQEARVVGKFSVSSQRRQQRDYAARLLAAQQRRR